MYNRYVRNDRGEYRRISMEQGHGEQPHYEKRGESDEHGARKDVTGGNDGLISMVLSKLRLDHIDTGDLLLLVILFLLFRDGEDEELLIALGLLLIM